MGYLAPPPMPAPVVVYKDVGGLVTDYEAATAQYRRENRDVRLHECRSACTLALSLPNVCVYPDAKIKFHQAYNAITRETDLGISSQLFASYPAAVQARLGALTREYRVMTGTELIALGMRNCNGDNSIMVASRRERLERDVAPTRLASAKPARPNTAPGGVGDLARQVQTAVASAFSGTPDQQAAPIRVAVAARQPLIPPPRAIPEPPVRPATLAFASADEKPRGAGGVTLASVDPGVANNSPPTPLPPPLPPRRPPSEAFAEHDAQLQPPTQAYRQLIQGAQPILSEGFVRVIAGETTPVTLLKTAAK